jgi:hypothetical protein
MRQPAKRRLGFFELQARTVSSITTAATSNFVVPAAEVAVPGSVVTILDIYDSTNNRGLGTMSMADARSNDPDAVGRPTRFVPAGNAPGSAVGYYIDRRPSVVTDNIGIYEYTYNYPDAIAGDGDSAIIPDPWHMAIAYAAGAEAAILLDMPEKAQELEGRFLAIVAERKSPMEEAGYRGIGGARRYSTIGSRY